MSQDKTKFREEVLTTADSLLKDIEGIEEALDSWDEGELKRRSEAFLERAEGALGSLWARRESRRCGKVPLKGATFEKRFAILRESLHRYGYFMWNRDRGNLSELLKMDIKPSIEEWCDALERMPDESRDLGGGGAIRIEPEFFSLTPSVGPSTANRRDGP